MASASRSIDCSAKTPARLKTSVEGSESASADVKTGVASASGNLLNLTTHLENPDEKILKTSSEFSFTTDHRAEEFKKTYRPFQILHVKERQQDSDLSSTACPTQDVCEGAVNFILDAERKGLISAGDFESILVIDEDVALGLEHEMSRISGAPNRKTGGRSRVVLKKSENVTMDECENVTTDECEDVTTDMCENAETDFVDMTEVLNQSECENVRENKKTPVANIGSNLTAEQRQEYEILLSRFDEIMAKSAFDVGFAKNIEHHIDTGDHRPIFEPLRRMNPIETEELRKQVGILIQLGFVRESIGNPWAAPAVLVRKKNGTFRFCIDHRKLNAITKKDRTPLPRIDDVHDRLAGSKFFTSLDFVSGYYHVPLEASSCEKTGFLTPFGLFEWTRMTMGLCNAPATFQRLMNRVLGPLMYKFCLAYLDDIVIYSKTFEEHLEHVDAVLSRIRDAGLKVQPAKSKFGADQLLYLGSNVSSNGISVDPEKIKSVEVFPIPKNQTMVRAFLGLTGYYRRFIFNYAKEAHPMIELTKTCAFRWGCEQQASFESLKLKLMRAPVLSFPDFKKPFYIHCDASNLGVGAILKQKDDENREKVIAYASRVLQPHERKYPVTHKECLAIIYAIDQFRYYVAMTKFFVVTDHHSLCYLMKVRKPYGRLTYWALMLQDFDFEITYKPGVSHRDADALSRYPIGYDEIEKTNDEIDYDVDARTMCAKTQLHPLPDMEAVAAQRQQENTETEQRIEESVQQPENLLVTIDEPENRELYLHALQRQDGKWKEYIEYFTNPDAITRAVFRKKAREFKLEDGILKKRVRNNESELFLPVIPYPARFRILQKAHDDPMSGHLAGDRTWGRLRNRYYWPGIEKDVRHYTESCDVCLRSNVMRRAPVGMLIPLKPTTQPFSRIGIDKMGPIHTSAKGHKYIYVATDYCTKTIITTAAKDGDSIASLGILSKIITTFGPPEEVVCDNGTEFINEVVKTLMHENRIRLRPSAAYHPQTNGQTERANDTLSTMIRKYTDKYQRDWDLYLPKVTYAYNTSDHATTGMSPFFVLYGFHPPMVTDRDLYCRTQCKEDYVFTNLVLLPMVRKWIADDVAEKQIVIKKTYDATRREDDFAIGSRVMLRVPTNVGGDGLSARFRKPYIGPFEIKKKLSDNNYLLSGMNSRMKDIVNACRLKKYKTRIPLERHNEEREIEGLSDTVFERETVAAHENAPESAVPLRRSTRVRKPIERLCLVLADFYAKPVDISNLISRQRDNVTTIPNTVSASPQETNWEFSMIRPLSDTPTDQGIMFLGAAPGQDLWQCSWKTLSNANTATFNFAVAMNTDPENQPLRIMRANVGDYLTTRLLHAIKNKHFAITANEKAELVFTGKFYTPDLVVCDDRKGEYSEESYAQFVSRKRENTNSRGVESLATIDEEDEDFTNDLETDDDESGNENTAEERDDAKTDVAKTGIAKTDTPTSAEALSWE